MANNNYWMKLWFDILRDPKMGMLPDRLWRRVIELFLLAGQKGEEGLLPDVAEMAWQLNKSERMILTDLKNIKKTGIIDVTEDGVWFVTNFKKRNQAVSSSKRVKDFRMRERYEKGEADDNELITEEDTNSNEEVTVRNENSNEALQLRYQEEQKNRRTELTTTTTAHTRDEISEIVKAYETEIGVLTGMVRDKLVLALEEYPKEWFLTAFQECALNNKRSWSYAEAILKRWKVDGFQVDTRKKSGGDYKKRSEKRSDIPGYVPDKSNEEVVYDD